MSAIRLLVAAPTLVILFPGSVFAGMPSIRLTDVARLRLEAISFFLLVFLLAVVGVWGLWKVVRRDFPSLPRLSFLGSLGVVTLWGLLFVLVLTMISGARELLTPGAWKKDGWTYRLSEDEPSPPAPAVDRLAERQRKMEELRFALWDYARTHGGKFPPSDLSAGFAAEVWQAPDPSGMRYRYLGGTNGNGSDRPLAVEPDLFGGRRLVLFANGQVRQLENAEVARLLGGAK